MAASKQSPAFVALAQATAGAAGGVFASFVLMPLEVAKTQIAIGEAGECSTLGVIWEIVKQKGVPGLFQGVSTKCAETAMKNFVYFYVYDAMNVAIKRHQKATTGIKLILGYLAGVVTTVLTMPLEVLSTRMQVEDKDLRGVIASLLESDGFQGLFRGFWFNIILCVNPAIQNTAFDKMKRWLTFRRDAKPLALTPLQGFLLGAVAKAIATYVTFPLVRLKTMLQAGGEPHGPSAPSTPVNNTPKAAARGQPKMRRSRSPTSEMLGKLRFRRDKHRSEQGPIERLGQLYRGINSALYKSVLQAALLYMTKDQVARLVVMLFKESAKIMKRRNGLLKLGAFSGRPLPS
mmetsp:Transcript_60549/g.131212  ORF Transcript_60549/g.131212 Transcript_60549/m.131212 type:complete len:347 (-) Transcript_60549:200-1240(-)|eukprot:CAMPEP_0170619764 /NCGR_PEP_ID=MMETSP0224-20130122/27690_1 /TAXON_ID=285029 /ORGANISM="Togula jolla, Strain CCCM 725" /LENGTH=346 /DNA_ID=CAMNT_0010945875 /DNA_START=100 /DNA_END=1140 /DNA_ORIENTATION=+